MPRELEGKVAVVTGASTGIGAEIARRLAADGAAVVVNYASSKSAAEDVVAEMAKAGGTAVAVQAEVSQEADVLRMFAEARKAFGRVDILVNNAGVYEFGPIGEMTEAQYRRIGIAPVVAFVASDKAGWITGQALVVSGGDR
jgi:3-oxoacyl-[acyl-carrier protein] reductase